VTLNTGVMMLTIQKCITGINYIHKKIEITIMEWNLIVVSVTNKYKLMLTHKITS